MLCDERGKDVAKPKICYHGTAKKNFDKITESGLKVPDGRKLKHATDSGWYGKGIYVSKDITYAKAYSKAAKQLFLCLCLSGKMYPSLYAKDMGKGCRKGYDSHYAADISKRLQMSRLGKVNCQSFDESLEWVFFDASQLLLCHLVTKERAEEVVHTLEQVITYLATF